MKTHTHSKPKTLGKNNDLSEDFSQASKKWFDSLPIIPIRSEECTNVTGPQVSELKEEAKKCNETETAEYYNKNQKSNSTFHWMKTIMSKGTLADKVASYTVVIQNSPVHNLDTLKNFISLVKIEKHQESNGLIDTLTQLFIEDLLIPNRKLQSFEQKKLSSLSQLSCGNAITRRKILSLWYFEDQLKQIYSSFIDALNSAAHNSITATKEKAIAAMSNLLSGNPEQEKKLLSFIVNKLGDPLQKVASKAIYCLEQLLRTHSNMQSVVLNEVEKLIFRHNISTKAQYYGLCFLSQFYLNHEESDIAKRLIEVYFGFFKACVKKGEVDSRMMSALLMGVNRAYPYANLEKDKISEHLDTIYRVVHIANFNVGLQALTLLYHVSGYENNATDRFYCALYKKLLDPQLSKTTHQAMLLSLVYKALIKDDEVTRVKAVMKRLFQLCLHLTPSFTCGILYLISQLIGKHKKFNSGILEQISPDALIVKKGKNRKGKKVEDKFTLDMSKHNSTNGESNCTLKNTNNSVCNESLQEIPDVKPELMDVKPSDYTLRNLESKYDPFNRNPLYAGSEQTTCSELHYLRQHFHPTISLYANNILNGEIIKYQGDPLKDFTLIRFLDRFVFKNPKKENEIQQGPHPTFGRRKLYRPVGAKSMAVTSFNYMRSKEENIPVDEQFLYMYLNKKYSNKSLKNMEEDSDTDSVASDEFEEMLENLGGTSRDLDENLDFMNDVENSLKTTKKSSAKEDDNSDVEESDTDLEDDNNEGIIDEDLMETGDEDLVDGLDDDDDEDLSFDDGEDEDSLFDDNDVDTGKNKKSKKNKKGMESIFASADEFASLLDEEGISKKKSGGANTLSNLDQAGTKQINWEEDRHRWLSGYKRAVGKRNGRSMKRTKKHNSDTGNKKKRFKK
ncbi:hypothetical protein WA026_020157 [Henosepilachna vigintioctopunctata]|uniref:CCAAT/enhancer-binding protein zeta n=1 Tax=Henosepilachna vigintioctopunctata TaxID=420089 RepID=A0AAW1UF77_9CUCU